MLLYGLLLRFDRPEIQTRPAADCDKRRERRVFLDERIADHHRYGLAVRERENGVLHDLSLAGVFGHFGQSLARILQQAHVLLVANVHIHFRAPVERICLPRVPHATSESGCMGRIPRGH